MLDIRLYIRHRVVRDTESIFQEVREPLEFLPQRESERMTLDVYIFLHQNNLVGVSI